MPATVNVQCNLNNGLLPTLGAPWFGGHSLDLIDQDPVLLRPGPNVIDGRFWRAWLSDHAADADVLIKRYIYEI
jgi:hypothetical protein